MIDAIHLVEAQGSDVRIELLYSLSEMAPSHGGCAGMQLAQTTVVHQSIVAHGAKDDLGKYVGSFLVLPNLA